MGQVAVAYMVGKIRTKLGMADKKAINDGMEEAITKSGCSREEARDVMITALKTAVEQIEKESEEVAKQA